MKLISFVVVSFISSVVAVDTIISSHISTSTSDGSSPAIDTLSVLFPRHGKHKSECDKGCHKGEHSCKENCDDHGIKLLMLRL